MRSPGSPVVRCEEMACELTAVLRFRASRNLLPSDHSGSSGESRPECRPAWRGSQSTSPAPSRTSPPRECAGLSAIRHTLRDCHIVQNVDHARSAHARRIINTGLLDTEVLAELLGPHLGQALHVI